MGESDLFVPGFAIPRRLTSMLDQLLDRKVAVIQGPAGFHKTQLVRAWLSLHPDVEEVYIQALVRRNTDQHSAESLRVAVREKADSPIPVVVWMDHHDYITNVAVLNEAMDVIDSAPYARLILSGRARPIAPLGGLAVRGDLVEITAYDLAYTDEEVEALLTSEGDPSALERLKKEFEGWPIAIEMASGREIRWEKIPAVMENIDGFLREEVLDSLSDDDMMLLEDLSPLPEFSLTGANRLVSGTNIGPRLANLAAAGIPLSWGEGNIIRFNPTLRRFLSHAANQRDPERAAAQNRKAAQWLQRQGKGQDAIEHALNSRDEDLVMELLTHQVANLLPHHVPEARELLESFGGRLPDTFQLQAMQLLLLSFGQQEMESMTALQSLRQEIPEDAPMLGMARFHLVVLNQARHSGYTRGTELVAEAVEFAERLMAEDTPIGQVERAGLLMGLGTYQLMHGDLDGAHQTLQEAVTSARISTTQWLTAFGVGALALTHSLLGGAGPAVRMADESLILLEKRNDASANMFESALLAKAIIAFDLGKGAEAREHMQRLESLPHPLLTGNAGLRSYVKASLAVDADDLQGALAIVATAREVGRGKLTPFHQLLLASVAFDAHIKLSQPHKAAAEIEVMEGLTLPTDGSTLQAARARLAMLNEKPQAAFELLHQMVESQPTHSTRQWLHLLMTLGVAASASGHANEALDAYQQAGVLADRLGLSATGARHTRAASAAPKDAVRLTKAELSALHHLDSDLPLSKVADQLYISPNTLKTHLRRIYKKLDVSGRDQAIERARLLGLL